jgi:hypothetical protein
MTNQTGSRRQATGQCRKIAWSGSGSASGGAISPRLGRARMRLTGASPAPYGQRTMTKIRATPACDSGGIKFAYVVVDWSAPLSANTPRV